MFVGTSYKLALAGEQIKTYNIDLNQVENKEVLEIYQGKRKNIIKIIFSDKTININTSTHPYYVIDKGYSSYDYKKSTELHKISIEPLIEGDMVYKLQDDIIKEITIVSIEILKEEIDVYNLSDVEDNHNFFANGVLVHNKKIENDKSNTSKK